MTQIEATFKRGRFCNHIETARGKISILSLQPRMMSDEEVERVRDLFVTAPKLRDTLYCLGGGDVYLEEHGRLCFCARHGNGGPEKHSTSSNDAWAAYSEAVGG